MDIVPKSNEARLAVDDFNKLAKNVCASDPTHRCNEDCKYYITRRFSTSRCPKVIAVCKDSRHVHECMPHVCTLGVKSRDTCMTCSVTGMVVNGPEEYLYATTSRPTVGCKTTNGVHWLNKKRIFKSNRTSVRVKAVREVLHLIFCSEKRKAISRCAVQQLKKNVSRITGKFSTKSVKAYMTIFDFIQESQHLVSPPAEFVPDEIVALIAKTIEFVRKEGKRRGKILKKNDACLTLGLVQLYATGFAPLGSEILAPNKWISKHALSPVQIGKLPSLRCRQQTIAVRQIQQLLVTETGEALIRPDI